MNDGGAWTTQRISQAMVPHKEKGLYNSGNSQESLDKVKDWNTAQQPRE